jgi:caa(3)-type oxidase subunit IV
MTEMHEAKDLQAPHVKWTKYVAVAIVLAVITTIEVSLAVTHILPQGLTTIILIAFTLTKAGMVMAFYMHLKYDARWYSMVLVFPLFMLVVLFGVVIIAAVNWQIL